MEDNSLINQPSEDILDFLSDFEAVRFAQTFVKTFSLKDEHVPLVMGLAEDVTYGDVTIESLPQEMQSRFGLGEADAKKAALQMAEARFIPIKQHIPHLMQTIGSWGADVSKQDVSPEKETDPTIFLRELISKLPIELDAHLFSRLENILSAYITGKADEQKTIEQLGKSQKTAGMEINEEDAKRLLAYVNEKRQGIVFASDDSIQRAPTESIVQPEPTVIAAVAAEIKEAPSAPAPVVEEKKSGWGTVEKKTVNPQQFATFTKEDEQEVARIAEQKQAVFDVSKEHLQTIAEMTNVVCENPALVFSDPTLTDRCRQVVDSRLRDARTPQDVRSIMERSVDQGGLGVSGRALSTILQVIEQGFDAMQSERAKLIAEEKEQKKIASQQKETEKIDLAKKETQLLDQRYASVTGKAVTETILPVAPSSARVSMAQKKEDVLARQEAKIDPSKVLNVIEEVKQVAQEPKPQNTVKPHMMDVRPVQRLVGPVEELKFMQLTDFRRLSKDPMHAIQKIKDTVELVGDQGFEKQVEAIRAWQSSPMNKLYLDLAKQALVEGGSLEDVRSKKESQKEPTLSKEELAALLKLNADLRF